MTKINVISGFLGAGKTTLIKKLLDGAFPGEKVILLENEYGEVGIDGGFMKDTGIQVTELNSGCICCTLVGDFTDAIGELMEKYSPDRILIEPSGVGKLSDIRGVVHELSEKYDVTEAGCATVADVNKCRMYAKNFGEFFLDQIQSAETIVLSRTQSTTQEKLDKAVELLKGFNGTARIVTTPWDQLEPAQLLSTIEHPDTLLDLSEVYAHLHDHDEEEEEEEEEEHGHHHDHEHHDHDEHGHHHHDHDDEDEHEHHHDHDEDEEHEHHHHDHDEDEHDEHHHDHHHGHHHHHHHHHHGHDADEVFQDIGVETAKKFDEAAIRAAVQALDDEEKYGAVLRAKGILQLTDGTWLHFDYVPGEFDLRKGPADYTGRLCVIGVGIKEDALKELFGI